MEMVWREGDITSVFECVFTVIWLITYRKRKLVPQAVLSETDYLINDSRMKERDSRLGMKLEYLIPLPRGYQKIVSLFSFYPYS